jgi:hypothetical protein
MAKFDVNLGLVISKMALEKEEVNYLFREEPHSPKDSGWRLFCGTNDETIEEEATDMEIYPLSHVLSFQPRLEDVFNSEHDTFEWSREQMKFVEVHES